MLNTNITIQDLVNKYYEKFVSSRIQKMETDLKNYVSDNFPKEYEKGKENFNEFVNAWDVSKYFDLYDHSTYIPKPLECAFIGFVPSKEESKKAHDYLLTLVKTANYKFANFDYKFQISCARYRLTPESEALVGMFLVIVPREFRDPNKY